MKRVLLGTLILVAGTAVFAALRHSTGVLGRRTVETRQTLIAQTQLLAEAHKELKNLEGNVRSLSKNLVALGGAADPPASDLLLSCIGSNHVSAAQSEALLAQLGFNWATTGDYVVVSKDILTRLSLLPMQGTRSHLINVSRG